MRRRAWILFLVAGSVAAAAEAEKTLAITVQAQTRLELPDIHFSGVKRLPDGALVFRTADRWGIHAVGRKDGGPGHFSLHSIPQAARGTVEIGADYAADGNGTLYFPGTYKEWRAGAPLQAGIFVFSADGRHVRTIGLPIGGRPERIVVDAGGSLYVVALDPQCVWQRQAACMLLHKYSPSGAHVASFGAVASGFRADGAAAGAPELARLREEAERSHLWLQDGVLHHVLPRSRSHRVYDLDGQLIREVVLEPPRRGPQGDESDRPEDTVWRVVGAGKGQYLVNWLHAERAGNGQRMSNYLAVHDESGKAVSAGALPPLPPSIPFYCDADGNVYFIHLASATEVELLRTSMRLQ